ncbi:MAG: alcohol dehydrogenase catalytic domain-containing protein [Actinomycetota bacterium]|nr:alcohol dehydrogenase catalytic domain-containing protein [Actinomycetota bacterium]
MRAAVLHGLGDLRVEEVPDPRAGPGEVVVSIEAALTCQTDVKAYRRGHPTYVRPPGVFGHEFAGRVAQLGHGVDGFSLGERVFPSNSAPCGQCFYCMRGSYALCEDLQFLFGGFAEAIRVPARLVERNLHRLPDHLPVPVAALAEPLAAAVKAVSRADLGANVRQGAEVAVLGAGALGVMLTACLAAEGARVLVVDPHKERLALAEQFGAAGTQVAAKDSSDVEAVRGWANGGRGPDHVFEAVGSVAAWELAVEMVRPGGTVHLLGGCPSESRFSLRTFRPHYEEVRLQGSFHHDPAMVRRALGLLATGLQPWELLLGPQVALGELAAVLDGSLHADASKVVVRP